MIVDCACRMRDDPAASPLLPWLACPGAQSEEGHRLKAGNTSAPFRFTVE